MSDTGLAVGVLTRRETLSGLTRRHRLRDFEDITPASGCGLSDRHTLADTSSSGDTT